MKKLNNRFLISAVIAAFLITAMTTATMANGKNDPATGSPEAVTTASSISGFVSDRQTGETLAGVMVELEGTTTKVYTDLDGRFTIQSITPGSYNLVLTLISYNNSLVEDIKVQASEQQTIEVKLSSN